MVTVFTPRRLVVACMNGASASFRAGGRQYFSDVVGRIVKERFDILRKQTPRLFYDFMFAKGGIGRREDRNITKHILEFNKPDNVLLLCGKSYGGRDIVRILNRLKPRLEYRAIHLILVDVCWIGRLFNRLLRIRIPQVNKIRNYYQRNMWFLNGARLNRKSLRLGSYIECDLSKSNVAGEKVDHWNIIHHYTVRIALEESVERLFGVLGENEDIL